MTEDEMKAAGIDLINSIFECGAEIEARHGPMPLALFLVAVRGVTAVIIAECVRGDAGTAARETEEFCERLRVQVARNIEEGRSAIRH